jgi:hypothetical protein
MTDRNVGVLIAGLFSTVFGIFLYIGVLLWLAHPLYPSPITISQVHARLHPQKQQDQTTFDWLSSAAAVAVAH